MLLDALSTGQLPPLRNLFPILHSLPLQSPRQGVGQIKLKRLIAALRLRLLVLINHLLVLLDNGAGANHSLELALRARIDRHVLVRDLLLAEVGVPQRLVGQLTHLFLIYFD